MQQLPDFLGFLDDLLGGFDFDFGSIFSVIASLLSLFGGGMNGTA